MAETIKIGGELESMATGKIVAAASSIKDKSRNKTQEAINGDVEAAIAEQSAQFDALSEETSSAVASASESARQAEQYLADLQEAIQDLPDGQAVSAEVAQHTMSIEGLEGATTLGQDAQGNNVKPSDVQAAMPTKEFMEVKTDSEGHILWAIENDGHTRFYLPVNFEGDTHGVKDARLEGYYTIASKEWSQLVLDAEDNIVFGIKTNGEVVASTMDANLAAATIKAIEKDIKKEYDEAINELKAEASDPLDKYVSLASGISQDDIENGTSKYDEIAKKSSNPNMSQKACAVLYNLMKLEKENRFLATWFLNIDYRGTYHPTGYNEQFRTEVKSGDVVTGYLPIEPENVTFDPLTTHAYGTDIEDDSYVHGADSDYISVSSKTPLIYIFDVRELTDRRGYTALQRAEKKAIYLTLMKKMWVDYKAIPVLMWHETNPYCPIARSADEHDANKPYFLKSGYTYTYDDVLYPQEHKDVIYEILHPEIKRLPSAGVTPYYPSDDYTLCGFDVDLDNTDHPYTADSPAEWFDDRCQEVGQFIKDLYTFIGEEIPIIFRLWHECEDSWQWWGASMCTPDDYKEFFKLTVTKLKTYSESNSILFGYCTDKNFYTPLIPKGGVYDLRYPGDDYVDIVGYDDYDIGKPNALQAGLSRMRLVSSFAKAHGKPAFVWESGNESVNADWFNTWVSVLQTAGINFSALMHWYYSYPPAQATTDAKFNQQTKDYVQYYNRSNMPCAEDNFDLTTITE